MSRRTQVLSQASSLFRLRGSHPVSPDFPFRSSIMSSCSFSTVLQPRSLDRFGLLPFRSPLLRESFLYFLFLQVLRCFSSPRLPRHKPALMRNTPSRVLGSPIRISTALRMLTAYRRISLFAASFFASLCLGIRHTLFLTLPIGVLDHFTIYFRLFSDSFLSFRLL